MKYQNFFDQKPVFLYYQIAILVHVLISWWQMMMLSTF